MTTSQVSRKDTSRIHAKTFTIFGIYLLYTQIKVIIQVYSMLRQGRFQGCNNKVHIKTTCDITVKISLHANTSYIKGLM